MSTHDSGALRREADAPTLLLSWRPVSLILGLALAAVLVLRWQGRVWWCRCGRWFPICLQVNSQHNSQHLFDAYTLSHVLHGVLFFGLLWLLRRRWSLEARAVIAATIEVLWEIMENSPVIIDRYRTATISLGYTGDSILNSLGDIGGFVFGFYLARKLGLWRSAAVVLIVELLMLWAIRDNLTLNVLMLFWPIDAIRRWQSGI